ncbi:MAG: type II secretion system GspH family protein [Lachnospiraceae bacterium]|nr:type II secretion system GspH family protein [Lachnospiraceae bacterium]
MKIYDRLKKVREDNKGFTLVELIVVLVILAILAAILVPALLGYIDRAKESQYELEAKAVLTAMQGEASRAYAYAESGDTLEDYISADDAKDGTNSYVGYTNRVADTASVTELSIDSVTTLADGAAEGTTPTLRDNFTITGCEITFVSANGNNVTCVLVDKTGWTCKVNE